jgi:enterochelin esterase-like enzyme
MLASIAALALANAAAAGGQRQLDRTPPSALTGETFPHLLRRLAAIPDTARREEEARIYVTKVREAGGPLLTDSTVTFCFHGDARRVGVPGDMNGWSPAADTMHRVPGTRLFHVTKRFDPAARFEYKIVADSVWMLDPVNPRTAVGGYGANSEVWMPEYRPPPEILYDSAAAHGRVDTIRFRSAALKRAHPVFVYRPPGAARGARLPVVFFTDGGEYISLALALNVLDNLIAAGAVRPVVAVFVDARTDPGDAATSKRMIDYTMSDTFLRFLTDELRPRILRSYPVTRDPEETAILGASLGGLMSTYAAFRRPDVFGLAAAQSPAYWWDNERLITLVRESPRVPARFWIDTGTMRDAQEHARIMRDVMRRKGYDVKYTELPEGHNWVNWRARLDDILIHFWGTRR